MAGLQTLVVKDRRIDFGLPKECVTLVGGKHVNYTNQSFQMSSLGSGASLSATISDTQALLRTSYLKFSATVNVSGTTSYGGATGILQYGYFGLNSNPLWKIINNVQLTLGNYSNTTSNVNTTIDLQTRVRKSQYVDWSLYGAAATVHDNVRVNYNEIALTNKSVFSAWYAGSLGHTLNSRLSRINVVQSGLTGGAGTAAITVDIIQPLNCISPFIANNDPRQALVRPGSITFTINTISDALQLFSCGSTGTTALSLVSVTNIALDWVYATIDIADQLPNLPPQVYPAYKWDYNLQTVNLPTQQGMNTVNINQVVFSTQPELIIIACRPQFAARTVFTPNYYYPIVGCNLNYNESNVLNISGSCTSTTTTPQVALLYQLCLKNGLDMDFDTWTARDISGGLTTSPNAPPLSLAGGFIVINPLDLLNAKNPASAAGTTAFGAGLNFSGTLNIYNPDASTPTCDLVILRFCPQEFVDQGMGSYIQCDIRPNLSNLRVLKDPYINYDLVNNSDITGGNIFHFIRDLAQGVDDVAQHTLNIADSIKNPHGREQFQHKKPKHMKHMRGGRMIDEEDIETIIDKNSSTMRDRLLNY
jgi:hypothetical protein